MFNYEEQSKTKHNLVRPQGDDSSKSKKRNSKCYSSYISSLQFRLLFPVLLDDGLAYETLDMQVAEKEMRESPTHRQPKQCFCIIQNQCILLLWSRLFRRIILSIHWTNLFPVDSPPPFCKHLHVSAE